MNVELMSVGTELLLGDIVNTNVAYLSRELAHIGINVYKHTTVGDNKERLLQAFHNAFVKSDTVIVTGGLGPTEDDITSECAAAYFGRTSYFNETLWQKIEAYLRKYRKNNVLTANNRKTAYVPEGALLFENRNGTAPGVALEQDGKRIILLPGPPNEMKPMFIQSVKPYLQSLSNQCFVSRYVRFYDIGESLLETKLKHYLDTQKNPTLALYAKTGEVLLRITASAASEEAALELVNHKIAEINQLVGKYIYLIGDETIADSQTELHRVIARELLARELTISVAESITGGYISSLLIENSGISKSFIEGIICYANESKVKTLGVKEATLKRYGAVSEQTAHEMVVGTAKRFNTDVAIATTGIAGPTNDGSTKPVGLVFVAVYYRGEVRVKECQFNGNRNIIRERTAREAFNELRKMLQQQKN
ncbi:competence/damage-inducible protein A [Aerococcaceae bacterium NML191292]|nr:competence/damage-inducible protein A [Aerococcaceae bacterium NML191292]MCW6682391.1 competence/damage-inducible protein A [Aerococcaceae bacterium NML160702]